MEHELKKRNKKVFKNLRMAGFFLVVFFLGFYFGGINNQAFSSIKYYNTDYISKADFAPFWKAWQILEENYPEEGAVDDETKLYGAIKGLAESYGDPYTTFFTPEESKAFDEQISGSFGGVGIELGIEKDTLTVVTPLKDTPAYNAGIKSGDYVLTIDNISTTGMDIDQAISKIRGEVGTEVTLGIFREGDKKVREVKLVRALIDVPTLESKLDKNGIYTISLYEFGDKANSLFDKAISDFAKSNSNKLILDLRGNPGGYLDSAVHIASYFLPAGATVVSEDYGYEIVGDVSYSSGLDLLSNKKYKLVILIDGGSASASEILAGALSENGVATLVGEKSYGKGSVQQIIPVTKDTKLKVTIAKWKTPKGNWISKIGITPDFVVEADETGKVDTQMNKAIEILLKK